MHPTTGQELELASHVRACGTDGHVILLDLRRGTYMGVDGVRSNALAERVAGWPRVPDPQRMRAGLPDVAPLTDRLMSQRLLANAAAVRPPHPTAEEATTSLDAGLVADTFVDTRQLWRFFRSAARASLWLRCRSLESIANDVAARRARLARSDCGSNDSDAVKHAAAAYERLRPFLFTARENCLHDSLALVDFLASGGLAAQWIIGVKTRPFGAHSWVQSGGTVLNDQHEHVRRFCPILIV